jgi:hypothetical protein
MERVRPSVQRKAGFGELPCNRRANIVNSSSMIHYSYVSRSMAIWLRQFTRPVPATPVAKPQPHPAVYVFTIMMLS